MKKRSMNIKVNKMKEIVYCPNCKKGQMIYKLIWEREEIKEIPLESKAYSLLNPSLQSSGTITFDIFSMRKPLQVIFECLSCGYTKVFDRESFKNTKS